METKIAIPFYNEIISHDIEKANILKIFNINSIIESFHLIHRIEISVGCKANIAPLLADYNVEWLFTNKLSHGLSYALNAYSVAVYEVKEIRIENIIKDFISNVINSNSMLK